MAMLGLPLIVTAMVVVVVLEVRGIGSHRYEGRFFDPGNFTYAECIPPSSIQTYSYYGSKSTDRKNSSCAVWKDVMKYHLKLMRGYNQFFFADERLDHNYCRTVRLDTFRRDRRFNNASAHSYVHEDGWQHGPWCYVKLAPRDLRTRLWGKFNSDYSPQPCFDPCGKKDPSPPVSTTPPPKVDHFFEYAGFIEYLADTLFDDFDHGPSDYYDAKPSDELLSETFKQNRKLICYIGMPFMFFVIGLVFLWHFYKTRKATKALNVKLLIQRAAQNQVPATPKAETSPTATPTQSPATTPDEKDKPNTGAKSPDKKKAPKAGKQPNAKKPKASKLRKK
uniref:Kringle domain-containing protein n=1 Tax=Panagrellus redivivus TaxID=6233 RepID=A0A7E4VIP1_PANRE